ncbi:MAG: DUF4058 family protein [Planctomycetota bacterium]|nr:DUF4058 family protein [Planctomycetota bacterium]
MPSVTYDTDLPLIQLEADMSLHNPFPGMNPYLERHWGDVHTRFMVYACDQINSQLPGDLQARVEEALTVDSEDDTRLVYPDVRVVEDTATGVDGQPIGGVMVAEPAVVMLADEPRTERHIEIVNAREGHRVITAIEFLSPTNKTNGKGREKYLAKQTEYIQGGVNLVEIDLLRGGEFSLAIPKDKWPTASNLYKICVRKFWTPEHAFTFGATLREALPNIPIPLRLSDPPVILQLQELINECYVRGRYASLDYSQPLVPKLAKDDANWVRGLLGGSN